MALTHVLTPLRVGGIELKNRVVRTAHATNLGGGTMGDALIAYHEARAKGGVALSIVEIMGVHPTSPGPLYVHDPRLDERYPRLLERIRPHGMKMLQQLWHAGHHGRPIDGSPPWSASDAPSLTLGIVPLAMTKTMIDDIVGAYAQAARKCQDWGLDGVELHAAHGYLPSQFVSPNTNTRTDDYGGSIENRARFTLEILAALRAAVRRDFVIGMRVADDDTVGGARTADYLALAQMAEARSLVDYVSASMGSYQSFPKFIGGMHEPMGYELPTSIPITRALRVPTIVIGRVRTLEEADEIIRRGDAALVGMTRAHIADPDLVAKTIAGRADRVRPCIACNQGCVGQLLGDVGRMGCAVNPAVGYEDTLGDDKLEASSAPKSVLIVGGGPAGMEAARVAALRGHRVTLCEASPRLGGALQLAARAPTRHGMLDIVTWLEAEIYRLGVDVRLSTYVEADDVPALGVDAVLVATGSTPRMDGIQITNPGEPISGMKQSHVLSSNELLGDAARDVGRDAVVIDDAGHFEAIAAAEYLLARGANVRFVTRHIAFGPRVESALMAEPALQRLSRGNFSALTRTRAIAIESDGVIVGPVYLPHGSNQSQRLPADTVVFVSLNRPNRGLHDELLARGVNAQLIGDALSPRFLETAMRDGHVAAVRL